MDDIFTNDELLSVIDSYCDKLIEVERLEEFKKHNLEFKGDAEKLEEGKFVVKSIQEHLKSELPVKGSPHKRYQWGYPCTQSVFR